MDRWTRIANELRVAVKDLDAARLDGRDALRITRTAAEVARLAETAQALTARRCVETGVWARDHDARVPAVTPSEWLADLSGSGVGAARDALAVGEALREGSATDQALRSGELSPTAAREVTTAGEVGGETAERRVLQKATKEGLRSAKTEAARLRASAPDAAERAARVHRERSLRRWTSRDQVWHLHLAGPITLGAEIEACLAPYHDAAWDTAAKQPRDQRDTPDAIAFDGMLAMARAARDGAGRPTSSKHRRRPRPTCRRGWRLQRPQPPRPLPHHHRRKTRGWTLIHHPDGTRTLAPPEATTTRDKPAAA